MRRTTMYRTYDGSLHETQQRAKDHAKKVYGDFLTTIAHALCKLEKYSKILDYLDANTETLAHLKTLKEDTTLEPGYEEDDD